MSYNNPTVTASIYSQLCFTLCKKSPLLLSIYITVGSGHQSKWRGRDLNPQWAPWVRGSSTDSQTTVLYFLQVCLWSKCQYLQVDVIKKGVYCLYSKNAVILWTWMLIPLPANQGEVRTDQRGEEPTISAPKSHPDMVLLCGTYKWGSSSCLPLSCSCGDTTTQQKKVTLKFSRRSKLFNPGGVRGQDGHRRQWVPRKGQPLPGRSPAERRGEWVAGRQWKGRPHGEGTKGDPGRRRALAKV